MRNPKKAAPLEEKPDTFEWATLNAPTGPNYRQAGAMAARAWREQKKRGTEEIASD